MRFYGMSLAEVDGLTNEANEMLWQAVTIVEAQETLVNMKVSSFPHMKKEDIDKTHRSIHRLAFPAIYEKPVEITPEHFARMING